MRWLRLDDSIEVSLVMSYDLNDGCCTGLDTSSRYHALLLNPERWYHTLFYVVWLPFDIIYLNEVIVSECRMLT
jgi:hypothetical protein